MILRIFLVSFCFLFITQTAWAGTPGDPDVNLFTSSNITYRTEVIVVSASTSFDPGIIITPTCIVGGNCRLVIEDCNGAITACETNTENIPLNIVGDWNGIPRQSNFENDLNCTNNCRRNGIVEDTIVNFNLNTISRGSRWIRACWIDDLQPIKKCSPLQRIHTYDDVRNPPAGQSVCRPQTTGNMVVSNRECYFKNPDNNFTAIPLVIFVDKNLIVANGGSIILDGVSVDFNSKSGTGPGAHMIQLSGSSNRPYQIFNTRLGYFDRNIPVFDRNMITFFGYSDR